VREWITQTDQRKTHSNDEHTKREKTKTSEFGVKKIPRNSLTSKLQSKNEKKKKSEQTPNRVNSHAVSLISLREKQE
jgi:hypothetical protein